MVGEGSVETEKIKNLEWGFFKMKRGKRGDCEEEESVRVSNPDSSPAN